MAQRKRKRPNSDDGNSEQTKIVEGESVQPVKSKVTKKCGSNTELKLSEKAGTVVIEDEASISTVENPVCNSETESSIKEVVQPGGHESVSSSEISSNPEVKELRKDLKTLLAHLSNHSGDFATGELLPDSELPVRPLIDVTGFGLLPFPVVWRTCDAIKETLNNLIDTSAKNTYKLNPSQFKIRNEMYEKQVDSLIQTKIKASFGLACGRIYGKIHKLLIHEKGGKFDEHMDTEKDKNILGTLIIQLPSFFEGGNLEVKHLNSSKLFENSSEGSATHCKFIAHYTSCPSESQEVTSGYRTALIYSLYWEGDETTPSPHTASANAVKLCETLNMLAEISDVMFLCWGLEHEYSDHASLLQTPGALTFFKGKDRNVVHGIKSAIEYDRQMSGEDRWEMCVATAHKRVNELAIDCKTWYSRRSGNCKGSHDFQEVDDWFFSVDSFDPLIAKSSIHNDLSRLITIPERDFVNFPTHEILPGQSKKRERYDSHEEFWGTNDLGEGCSGICHEIKEPNRVRWYQKKVLVLWRCDRSLDIRCWSSIDNAVTHVLTLLKKGDFVEGEEGFRHLWDNREKFDKKEESLAKLLEMCNILEDKDKAFGLLKDLEISRITSEVMAETTNRFCDGSILNEIKDLIRKHSKYDVYDVVQFCKRLFAIEPSEILNILVNHFIKEDKLYYLYRGFGFSSDPRNNPITTILLDYVLEKNLLSDPEVDTLFDKIHDLKDLKSAITLTINNKNGEVLNRLTKQYVKFASEIKKPVNPNRYSYAYEEERYNDEVEAAANIVKALVDVPKSCPELTESFTTTVNMIANLPKNKQKSLIGSFVAEILLQYSSENESSIPVCLQRACLLQIVFLKEIVSRGKPKMSCNPPRISDPDYFGFLLEGSTAESVFEKRVADYNATLKEYHALKNFVLKFKQKKVSPMDKERPSSINLAEKENQRTLVEFQQSSQKRQRSQVPTSVVTID